MRASVELAKLSSREGLEALRLIIYVLHFVTPVLALIR